MIKGGIMKYAEISQNDQKKKNHMVETHLLRVYKGDGFDKKNPPG